MSIAKKLLSFLLTFALVMNMGMPFSAFAEGEEGATPTPVVDATPTPTPAAEVTPTPAADGTPTPTPTADGTPMPTPAADGTPTPTPAADATPAPTPNMGEGVVDVPLTGTEGEQPLADAPMVGEGTAESPYIILTAAHLDAVRDDLAAHYKLGANIVFTDADYAEGGAFYNGGAFFMPIGSESAPFAGSFDGIGYAIENLKVNAASYAGLFGYVNGGTLSNITLASGSITATGDYVGGIAAYVKTGTVTGCVNGAEVSGKNEVGGIAGFDSGSTFADCTNSGSVEGEETVGGILGIGSGETKLKDCTNSGAVTGIATVSIWVGGIAGYTNGEVSGCENKKAVAGTSEVGGIIGGGSAVISSCTNSGSIIGTPYLYTDTDGSIYQGGESVGGIAGQNGDGGGSITDCTNTGNVSGMCCVGGIAGLGSGTISDCTNSGSITCALGLNTDTDGSTYSAFAFIAYVGGITGFSDTVINNCENSGPVTGHYVSGGIVGGLDTGFYDDGNTVEITNCKNSGMVIGGNSTGGIAGLTGFSADGSTVEITYCENSGSISGTSDVGGIVGELFFTAGGGSLTVSHCSNSGSISGTGFYTGGIAGSFVVQDRASVTVSECSNSGSVNGEEACVGGIFGDVTLWHEAAASVSDCTNSGFVKSEGDRCGGIIGKATVGVSDDNTGSGSLTLSGCHNETPVHGNSCVGGIVGYLESINEATATVTRCSNTASLMGKTNIGGIAGAAGKRNGGISPLISECWNSASIRPKDSQYVGGIVGDYGNGELINCFNTGDIMAERYAGGIAGYALGSFEACYNTGYVAAYNSYGPIGNWGVSVLNYTLSGVTDVGLYETDTLTERGMLFYDGFDTEGNMNTVAFPPRVVIPQTGSDDGIVDAVATVDSGTAASSGSSAGSNSRAGWDVVVGGTVIGIESVFREQATFLNFDFTNTWTMAGHADYPYPELQNNPYTPVYAESISVSTNVEKAVAGENIYMKAVILPPNTSVKSKPLVQASEGVSGSSSIETNYGGSFAVNYTMESAAADEVTFTLSPEFGTAKSSITLPVYKWAQGSGTVEDPYIINTTEELDAVRYGLSKHYALGSDITFTAEDFAEGGAFYNGGMGWRPIGATNDFPDSLDGTFDGKGYTIKGLSMNLSEEYINRGYVSNAGLFAYIYGTVKNINMTDISIIGRFNAQRGNWGAGGIIGDDGGSAIMNCAFDGSIAIIADVDNGGKNILDLYVGGLAGRAYGAGKVENCTVSGKIELEFAEDGAVDEDSYGTGYTRISAGGIVGDSGDPMISGCTVKGDVTVSLSGGEDVSRHGDYILMAGGIAGSSYFEGPGKDVSSVFNNTNYADVVVEAGSVPGINTRYDIFAAGIIACSDYSSPTNYSDAVYMNNTNYGDIAAEISGDSMDDVTARLFAGGIATSGYKADGCKNYGDVNAGAYCDFVNTEDDYYSLTAFAGGIMAVGESAEGCANYGDVTKHTNGNVSLNAAGGIIGMMGEESGSIGKITRCANHGTVKELGGGTVAADKASGCGGMAGISMNPYGVSFTECLNAGDVAAKGRKAYAGGIFGRCGTASAELRNCYNTGDITVSGEESAAGGIAGHGDLYYCYNTGVVSGQKYLSSVGAIAGTDSKAVACGYVEGTAETGLGTGFDNTVSFIAAEFAESDLFDAYDSSIWTKNGENETYSYPQLVNTLNEKQYVSGIELTVPDNQVKVGEQVSAAYVVSPADAEEKTLVWTSSNEKVAAVDENGIITGVAAGNAVITAAAVDGGGAQASVALRVITEGEEVPGSAIGVAIGNAVAIPGGKAKVPVTIDEASGANVIEFTVEYDTSRLVLDSAAAGALLRELGCDINAAEAGKVRFAFDSTDEIVFGGTLLELTFAVKETAALGEAYVRFGTEDEAMLLQRAESVDSLNYVDIEHVEKAGSISVVDILYGDVNFDGRVNTTDANIIRRYCVKLIDLSAEALVAGDVNLDGKVNVIDANIIRSYAVRLLDSLPYTGQ